MKLLTDLIFEQRGSYEGYRRQIDIKVNPGKFKNKVIENCIDFLKNKYESFNLKLDEQYAIKEITEILNRTSGGGFFSITMWPKSDTAILTTRAPTAPNSLGVVANDKVKISIDLATIVLSNEFYKILKEYLEGYGLVEDFKKMQRMRIVLPKDFVAVGDSDKEIEYEEEEKIGEFTKGPRLVSFGGYYATGNIKLKFVEEIKAIDLREYLKTKGFDTAGYGEYKDDDDDENEDEINEQRQIQQNEINIDDEIKLQKESPVFKTKKAAVINNVSKLIKSIDELTELIKEDPDAELSDLVSVFSDLVNNLNENGLIAK